MLTVAKCWMAIFSFKITLPMNHDVMLLDRRPKSITVSFSSDLASTISNSTE